MVDEVLWISSVISVYLAFGKLKLVESKRCRYVFPLWNTESVRVRRDCNPSP